MAQKLSMKVSYRTLFFLIATILLLPNLYCGGSGGPCAMIQSNEQPLPLPKPGRYEITIVATSGSKKGQSCSGTLELITSRPDDRSPTTGEGPSPVGTILYPLYGWLSADLAAVGATLASGSDTPSPDSQDPVYPGVLVSRDDYDWRDGRLSGSPILLIGKDKQTRNVQLSTLMADGAGIKLKVHHANDIGFKGNWSGIGRYWDGSGSFCAQRVSK